MEGFGLEVDVVKKIHHQLARLSTMAARNRVVAMVVGAMGEHVPPAPSPAAEEKTLLLPMNLEPTPARDPALNGLFEE